LAYGNKHQFDYLESGGLEAIEERLGRAREVLDYFKEADQIYPHAYENELKGAKTLWEKTEKDNNLIYHVRIPKKTDLPAIPRKSILSLGTTKFPLSKDFKDIFVSLVSVHVNKAVNLFQGQLKEKVFNLVNDLRTSNANVNSGLAAINMPALIEDELKQERIPQSIVTKAEDIRSKGGFHAIEVQEKALAEASNQANSMIAKVEFLI
jgi:programmed cell death 6-interacting protein